MLAHESQRPCGRASDLGASAIDPSWLLLTRVNFLFVGFDFDLFMFDVETKAVVDAHVLVGDPDQGEERDKVSAPIGKQQLDSAQSEASRRNVVAEAIFAGEEIKKFPSERDARACSTFPLAVLTRLAKHFFVSDGPGNARDRNSENQ